MKLFDAHTHTQFSAFKDDWRAVIARALEAEVGVINVGTQKDTSRRAVEIADEFPENVYAVIGLHPVHTDKSYHDEDELGGNSTFTSRGEEFDYEYYKKLGQHPKVVAIGECGLDYYRATPLRQDSGGQASNMGNEIWKINQEKAFRAQIELATELKKPLMIHCRASKGTDDAYEDALEQLSISNFQFPMIFHFFAGSPNITKKILELPNTYFTFGGVITFVRDYDKMIDLIPLDRIMLETDAPYVTPIPYRGKRNEPAYVVEVAKKMAELKGVSFETLTDQTTKTARKIFKI
jgi:TatD DNase family protein